MIRLTWRQFRSQAMATAVVLAGIAVVLIVTGLHLRHLASAPGVGVCDNQGCNAATQSFLSHDHHLLQYLGTTLAVLPAVIGMFWGAPLVARELETGTFRLSMTQGVTRTRWLLGKLAVVGLASAVTAGLFSLLVSWWASPVDAINMDRYSAVLFSERGIAPIGYAIFAFTLGVAAGAILRRTLPAMVVVLVGVVAVRELVTYKVRSHLLPAAHAVHAIGGPNGLTFSFARPLGAVSTAAVFATNGRIPGAWVYSTRILNNAGQAPSKSFVQKACPPQLVRESSGHLSACAAKLASQFHEVIAYQPASRYWLFQTGELAVYLVLALALLGGCLWWVRHRLG